ncbi:hypothetical protein FHETE_7258 [Fusarium heterosporum]|uniref:F-box domain-containing protein n=1 Tax=Fusarium heterosporum TaxID=42747 RepID=A0A8H5T7M8_FUSHE|nr:hypothetical protein FHETE_7258 [Fusarium heterosporum]
MADYMARLPVEIQIAILSRIPEVGLLSLLGVSKCFRKAITKITLRTLSITFERHSLDKFFRIANNETLASKVCSLNIDIHHLQPDMLDTDEHQSPFDEQNDLVKYLSTTNDFSNALGSLSNCTTITFTDVQLPQGACCPKKGPGLFKYQRLALRSRASTKFVTKLLEIVLQDSVPPKLVKIAFDIGQEHENEGHSIDEAMLPQALKSVSHGSSLKCFVRQFPELQSLTIEVDGEDSQNKIFPIPRLPDIPRLRSFRLNYAECKLEDLKGFFQRHKHTLTGVILYWVTIHGTDLQVFTRGDLCDPDSDLDISMSGCSLPGEDEKEIRFLSS